MGSRKSSVAVESGAQPEIHAAVRLYRGAQFVGLVQNLSQDVGPNSRLTELAPDAVPVVGSSDSKFGSFNQSGNEARSGNRMKKIAKSRKIFTYDMYC